MYFRVQLFRGKDGLRLGLVVGLCRYVLSLLTFQRVRKTYTPFPVSLKPLFQ